MNSLNLYEISEEYLSYLKSIEKHIFSSKESHRKHTRKYLSVAHTINGYSYYIPLSSPKNTDYYKKDGQTIIRNSIVPIIRITSKLSSGRIELIGTLKLSNMIPVPPSELTLYSISNESDSSYKHLIHKELLFIRKNKNKIIKNAQTLYRQKMINSPSIGYLKNTVNFTLLEQKHDEFIKITKASSQNSQLP